MVERVVTCSVLVLEGFDYCLFVGLLHAIATRPFYLMDSRAWADSSFVVVRLWLVGLFFGIRPRGIATIDGKGTGTNSFQLLHRFFFTHNGTCSMLLCVVGAVAWFPCRAYPLDS